MRNGSVVVVVLAAIVLAGSAALGGEIKSAGVKGGWKSPATWVGGALPGALDNVTIADGDTVTIDTTAAVNNLTVGEGVSGVLQFNKTTPVELTINGDFLVKAGAGFKVQTNTISGNLKHVIHLYGSLTHNGSLFDCRSGSTNSTLGVATLELTGSGTSTIAMNTAFSTTNGEFNSVVINKSGKGCVVLATDVFLSVGSSSVPDHNANLVFVRGLIYTGTNTLIQCSATSATVSGASDSSYVVGKIGRGMGSSSASKDFPVGDSTGYRPLKMRSTTGATSSSSGFHWVAVSVVKGNANTGSSTLANGIDKVSAARYYKATFNKGSQATTDMSFDKWTINYRSNDGIAAGNTNLRGAYSTNDRALWTGMGQTVAHTTDLTAAMTVFAPDSLPTASQVKLLDGQSVYVTFARVTGTTENSLEAPISYVEEHPAALPTTCSLDQNYPNPFNPATTINFTLNTSVQVSLVVYDILGREVATLAEGMMHAGTYSAVWNGSGRESGVYIARLKAGAFTKSIKMSLVK